MITSLVIHFILRVALFLGLYCLLLLFVFFVLGIFFRIKKRKEAIILKKWEQILSEFIASNQQKLPPLISSELPLFLAVWNNRYEIAHGKDRNRLNEASLILDLLPKILPLLKSRFRRKRLLGILCTGHLHYREAYNILQTWVASKDLLTSLLSIQALLQIDPFRAINLLSDQLISRPDWPSARLAKILAFSNKEAVTTALMNAFLRAKPPYLKRVIFFMEFADPTKSQPVLLNILKESHDPELLSAALQVIYDPLANESIKLLLGHPAWFVRVQAVKAVKKLALKEYVQEVKTLLKDSEWWVRYRATETLEDLT